MRYIQSFSLIYCKREGTKNNNDKKRRTEKAEMGQTGREPESEGCSDSALMKVEDITISLDYHSSICSLFYYNPELFEQFVLAQR